MKYTPILSAFLEEKSLQNEEIFQDFLLLENIQLKKADSFIKPQIEKRGDEIILLCSQNVFFQDFLEIFFQYYITQFPYGIPESHGFYELVKKIKKLESIKEKSGNFDDEKYSILGNKLKQLSSFFSGEFQIFYDSIEINESIDISKLSKAPFEVIAEGFQNEIEFLITLGLKDVLDGIQLLDDPQKYLQIAQYYFKKGDFESADIVCNQIIDQFEFQPKMTLGALFLLGEIAYHQGDFSGAQALFEKCFHIDNEYKKRDFLCYMGRIYSKHKNISKLQKIIIQMEDEKIFTIEYFQLKAIFYLLQKNYNEMMNVYRESLDNFPEAEELLYDLATVYAKVFHQFEISIEINKKNLQSNFRNLSYWKLLEFCFDRLHYFGHQEIIQEIISILEFGFPKNKNERGIFLFECLESESIDKIFELIFQKNTMEKRKR